MVFIKILKIVHKLIKKQGWNIPMGFFTFNFISKLVRTGHTDLLKEEVNKGDSIIDVGANIGYYTILTSKLVGSTGKIFAFEPDVTNYKSLVKHVKQNRCKNVTTIRAAVTDKSGKISFFLSPENSSTHRAFPGKGREKITVRALDLDSYIKKKGIKKIDFIKIDVEGYEPVVFKGMKKILKENPDIKVIAEFGPTSMREAGYDAKKFLDNFSKLGFKFYLVVERQKIPKSITAQEAIDICKKREPIDLFFKR